MESIRTFCGIPFNKTFSVLDDDVPSVLTNCFIWNIISDPVHGIFMITCAYLFGSSSKLRRKKAKGCISLLSEFLTILMVICCLGEVIISYALENPHPPAYVLSKMLSVAAWLMCFALQYCCRKNFRQYKRNNKYILAFSLIIFAATCVHLYTIIKIIIVKGTLNLTRWPVSYYGVYIYFFLNICFILSTIGIFCLKPERTSFNRSMPSLVQNVAINGFSSINSRDAFITSGSDSQGSYCEAYQIHKERHTNIYLGKAESSRNIISQMFFCWCNALMKKGYHRQLKSAEDLFILPNSLDTRSIKERFSGMLRSLKHSLLIQQMDTENIADYVHPDNKKKLLHVSLLKVLNNAFGKFYYSLGILKFIVDCLGFAGPLLLNYLVNFMEHKQVSESIDIEVFFLCVFV